MDIIRRSECAHHTVSVWCDDILCNCTVEIHLIALLAKISRRVRLFYDGDDVTRRIGAAGADFWQIGVSSGMTWHEAFHESWCIQCGSFVNRNSWLWVV